MSLACTNLRASLPKGGPDPRLPGRSRPPGGSLPSGGPCPPGGPRPAGRPRLTGRSPRAGPIPPAGRSAPSGGLAPPDRSRLSGRSPPPGGPRLLRGPPAGRPRLPGRSPSSRSPPAAAIPLPARPIPAEPQSLRQQAAVGPLPTAVRPGTCCDQGAYRGVSRSLPFSDLLALTSSDTFLAVTTGCNEVGRPGLGEMWLRGVTSEARSGADMRVARPVHPAAARGGMWRTEAHGSDCSFCSACMYSACMYSAGIYECVLRLISKRARSFIEPVWCLDR
jgi:hypothetical protein